MGQLIQPREVPGATVSQPFAPLPPTWFVETELGRVRYSQAGSGPDVVLLHGAMTSLEDMVLGPFDALSRSHRVTAFDRPGHGATPRRRLQGALVQQAALVRSAIAALGLRRPTLVGQSFGAALALAFALDYPEEIEGIVLISPIAFPEIRLEHVLFGPRAVVGWGDLIAFGPGRVFDAAIAPLLWDSVFTPQAMPQRFRALYPFELGSGPMQMRALGEEACQSLPEMAAAVARYPTCQVAVEILAGLSDLVAPPHRHALPLCGLLPDAGLTLLPTMGHMLHQFAIAEVVGAVDRASAS